MYKRFVLVSMNTTQHDKSDNKSKLLVIVGLLVAACALTIAALVYSNHPAPREQELLDALKRLPEGKQVSFSSLPVFSGFQTVCVLVPYAISSRTRSEEDLKRIFGPIDYHEWKNQIVDRYTDYRELGFYPVENDRLADFVSIKGINLRLAGFYFTEAPHFLAGCYSASDICVQKSTKEGTSTPYIHVEHCTKNKGDE